VSLVLDASLTLSWYFEDERTPAADALLDRVTNTGAVVPSIWRVEKPTAFRWRFGANASMRSFVTALS